MYGRVILLFHMRAANPTRLRVWVIKQDHNPQDYKAPNDFILLVLNSCPNGDSDVSPNTSWENVSVIRSSSNKSWICWRYVNEQSIDSLWLLSTALCTGIRPSESFTFKTLGVSSNMSLSSFLSESINSLWSVTNTEYSYHFRIQCGIIWTGKYVYHEIW